MRKGSASHDRCLVVANFTPQVYRDYYVRVPFFGRWREVLNTDSAHYGGTNVGNSGVAETLSGVIPKLKLTIPPLAVMFLVPEPT
jgi:1,4-alpha-glucan branching enzyme